MAELASEVARLLVLSVICAWIAWVWTKEEIFSEVQTFLKARCKACQKPLLRKLWYMPTCEVCFVHYPILACILLCRYRLLEGGILGLLFAWLFTAFSANLILSLYSLLRIERGKREAERDTLKAKLDVFKGRA